jgi:hypothetical protein
MNAKTIETEHNVSKKLFDSEKTNILIYSNESEDKEKEHEQSSPSPTIASSIDQVSPTPSASQPQKQEHKRFNCFYCSQAYSSDKERIKHIDYQHPGKLYYPTPEDFEKCLL